MSTHTPGPWRVHECEAGELQVMALDDTLVIEIPDADADDHVRSDARLIAAAPDLLEAAQTALTNLTPLYSREHIVIRHLRAAIHKATGGNND